MVLHGEEDAARLDVEGEAHGALGRLVRVLQSVSDLDLAHARRHGEDLRAGRRAGQAARRRCAERHRRDFINFYGDSYVESFDDR